MKNIDLIIRIFISAFFFFFTLSLSAKTIYYVTATGTGDGSSWSNATNNIQPMIDKAVSGDEVWVAKGTYYPTTETIARDPRSATFLLKTGVNMYGGFAGTETSISQRTLADLNLDGKVDSCELVNTTILSGDIDGVADVWTKTTNTNGTWKWSVTGNENNCYHVVTINDNNVIDGFSVIGGNANSTNDNCGGGIYSVFSYSSSHIINCSLTNCSASNNGGGIYSCTTSTSCIYTYITNCSVSNCSAGTSGGGIYSYSSTTSTPTFFPFSMSTITNNTITNCSAGNNGGGIYDSSISAHLSYLTNNLISNCSADTNGGGIYSYSSATSSTSNFTYSVSVKNCLVSNCSSGTSGGGIYSFSSSTISYYNYAYSSYLTNCIVSNCYAGTSGGGIYSYSSSTNSNASSYSSYVINCSVLNSTAGTYGGGIYSYSYYYLSSSVPSNSSVINCAVSNCTCTVSSCSNGSGDGIRSFGSSVSNCAVSNSSTCGIYGGTQSGCISPSISLTYIRPTSFIGIATTDIQKAELSSADWHLKEGSPCINAGTSTNVPSTTLTGNDINYNPRVLFGTIDIGAYEYVVPTISMPISEKFDTITSWDTSQVFYNSASINGSLNILWSLVNQKADFSWQTNLTSTYSQPIFTYQIDGTKTSKVYLRYDMYYQAYAGTITPLGTEKLNVEFSTDLITWSTIATYSNANGTIANQTYKYDISKLAAGKTFFIRFNANGANSNRIEKWEIDNVIIDADGITAVNVTKADKLLYSITDSKLTLRNIEYGSYVQIFDIDGKLIDSAKANSNILYFILPMHGVYILKASSESGITSRKLVL
jgi:hypothetical protein